MTPEAVDEMYHDFLRLMGSCPERFGLSGDHAASLAEPTRHPVHGSPMNMEARHQRGS